MEQEHKTKHKLIFRYTEGKYKDGITTIIDKKIYDTNEGLVIRFHKKQNDDKSTLIFRSQGPNKYAFIKQENGNTIIEKKDLTFDQLINIIREFNTNNMLKFAIDYFTELKQIGGSEQCNTLHGGATYCKNTKNKQKCIYLNIEDDINDNIYVTKKSVSKMQQHNKSHSRKLSKKLSKKLSRKLSKHNRTSRINYNLPKSK